MGPRKVRNLLLAHPGLTSWADLQSADLRGIDGISNILLSRVRQANPEEALRILERCAAAGIRYISIDDPGYPDLLRELYDAPVGLFARGGGPLDVDCLAVVGTRRASDYGRRMTRQLSAALVAAGLGTVSGMARGIDSTSHQATLDAGGHTVAVLGCGVDVVYPSENRRLYDRLLERGLLLSEYLPGTPPDGHHFPQRNRIISGLALGTLVVEAGQGSGALITALRSLDQNREVFAVPGRADDKRAAGCHGLIQGGAKLVQRIEDILSELRQPYSAGPGEQLDMIRYVPEPERRLLDYLGPEPVLVDTIAEDMDWNISELLSLLVTMELRGLVMQSAGKRYARA